MCSQHFSKHSMIWITICLLLQKQWQCIIGIGSCVIWNCIFFCCICHYFMREAANSGWSMLRRTRDRARSSLLFLSSSFLFFSLTVNGGHNHCHLVSEKNNMMDVEMTSSLGSMCKQNLLIHSGNSFTRDHPLPCEKLLHVSQLNLSCSDTRYCFQFCLPYVCLLLVMQLWTLYPEYDP